MSPKTAAPVAPAPRRSIDPAAYGFVPAADVRGDRPGADPDQDTVDALAAAGDWRAIAAYLAALPRTGEHRFAAIDRLGETAATGDGWLRAWRTAAPDDVDALSVRVASLIRLAWMLRSAKRAHEVAPDQWAGFHRLIKQAGPMADRAALLAPADPAPLVAKLVIDRARSVPHEEFAASWDRVRALVPHSPTALSRAYLYWAPRWSGSAAACEEFVEAELATAPVGSLLTRIRLIMLHDELAPTEAAARAAFWRGERMRAALDAALIDVHAADPSDPQARSLPLMRHWLAYLLHLAGRNREAIEQFRLIGPFAGADPWRRWQNPAAKFCEVRAQAVLAWEDAGRSG